MKKIFTLALLTTAVCGNVMAQDFTVLSTPEEVYSKSIELESGAKDAFLAVLNNPNATEEEIAAAMQAYQQKATPNAGYAFDMNYLLSLNAVTEENKGKYTKTALSKVWSTEIAAINISADAASDLAYTTNADRGGIYMRVDNAKALSTTGENEGAAGKGKFIAYQTVALGAGHYTLKSDAAVLGLGKGATLSAGETDSEGFAGYPLKSYSVNFVMDASADIKLGYKRADLDGNLTQVGFNNMELYKVSDLIAISGSDDKLPAKGENLNIQLNREFKAGQYYAICLPFIFQKNVFEDVVNITGFSAEKDEVYFGASHAGSDVTQARKPYLVKVKADADNIIFRGVSIESSSTKGGPWGGSANNPIVQQGNLVPAGVVPANCYYLKDNEWLLSDGTAPLESYSCYLDATNVENHPASLTMVVNSGQATFIGVVDSSDANALVNVYNIQGMLVKKGVVNAEALEGLPAGLYIVNGKKIVKY